MRNDCTMNVDVKISVSDCTPVCILYRNDNAAVICIHTADACHILHHNVIAPGFNLIICSTKIALSGALQ